MTSQTTLSVAQAVNMLSPMAGEYVWFIRCVDDHVLRLDFGEPHLKIQEPYEVSPDASNTVRASLDRRQVVPRGAWHLFVLDGLWNVTTKYGQCSRNDQDSLNTKRILKYLEGQKLISVKFDSEEQIWVFDFDLSGQLRIKRDEADDDISQWTLRFGDKQSLTWGPSGSLIYKVGQ